jgi:hypothetical protein
MREVIEAPFVALYSGVKTCSMSEAPFGIVMAYDTTHLGWFIICLESSVKDKSNTFA